MVKRFVYLVIFCCSVLPTIAGAASPSLNFAVIQPGQPGDTAAAQPVMDALAAYLQQHLSHSTVAGRYYNHTQDALSALGTGRPAWAIVSLGFFMEHGAELAMEPVAASRPSGVVEEQFYLLVAKDQQGDWRQLQGRVEGTALFQSQAMARLLFERDLQQLPFELEGTFSPLRAVRKVVRGQLAGVVLDQLQFQAMQALPLLEKLQTIQCSGPLPSAAVVWFGEATEQTQELTTVLRRMAADPEASPLLQMLQSEGFGPADPRLQGYRSLLP